MLGQRRKLVARPGHDPLQLLQEVGVHRIVACVERLDRLVATGDQDS